MRRFLILLACLLMTASSALAEKTITLTFTGDVTIGSEEYLRDREFSFDTFAQTHGYEYFFKNVRDLFAEDDLTVINLENVLSDNRHGEDRSKTYRFRGPTDFVKILTLSGIEAANLANNHAAVDYGNRGLRDTLETLRAAGIGAFGVKEVYIFEKDGVKIALMGIWNTAYRPNRTWMEKEIARLKNEEGVSAVIFSIHSGQEYSPFHGAGQRWQAKTLIDAGADLVIMHHPHVVQGIEIINNRTVCYSLGNFCFGGNKTVRALESLVVRATLTFSDEGEYLGQQLTLYPAHVSGTTPDNDYQPRLVTGEDALAVMALIQQDTEFELPPFDEELGGATLPYLPAVSEEAAE